MIMRPTSDCDYGTRHVIMRSTSDCDYGTRYVIMGPNVIMVTQRTSVSLTKLNRIPYNFVTGNV